MFKKAAFPKNRKEEPLGTSQTPVGTKPDRKCN